MKHILHISITFIMSLSLAMANFVVYGSIGLNKVVFIDSKLVSEDHLYFHPFEREFSTIYDKVSYGVLKNCLQDTLKINSDMVLFGRSHLKNHFELHGKKITVDEHKRNNWIQSAADLLRVTKNSDIDQALVMNELVHEDYYQASYRLVDKGLIKFEDGSYLKLMSTSTHTHKDFGDITLAVNAHGDMYINQGHICGSIIHFRTRQRDVASTAVAFLANFMSDTDDEPWILYSEDNNKNKTNKQKI